MKRFKFLTSNELEDEMVGYDLPMEEQEMIMDGDFTESDPSWMWACEMGIEDTTQYESITVTCRGIREFLGRFPNHYIVPMVSITDGNHFHDCVNTSDGWGFDIQNDELTFVYLRI